MKKFGRKLVRAFFDVKMLVAMTGFILSIITHELFHIMLHWNEIEYIRLMPDRSAIVEVVFTPSAPYNLIVEEGIAYGITMITLILTAMIIGHIHDERSKVDAGRTILSNELRFSYSGAEEKVAMEQLAHILGVEPNTQST